MADTDLLTLRNKMKRDPRSYIDELQLQIRHYHSCVDVFKLNPGDQQTRLGEIVSLLSHVTPSFPNELKTFPNQLLALIEEYQDTMEVLLRRSIVQAIILLRNRRCLEASVVLPLFFKLFRCPDKELRALLASHIVSDVTNMNQKHKDNKLNRLLQNFMFTMLQDHHAIAAKKSLSVLVKLYKKKIWDDEKTVNVIASACFSPEAKVRIAAMHFFLGIEDADANAAEEEDMPVQPMMEERLCKGAAKKSKQRAKKMRKAAHAIKRKEKRGSPPPVPRFAALQLLNDPNGFCEKLLSLLRKCNDGFDAKLVIINLLSRVIATHQVVLLNFYPFVQRYLQAHQKNITNILAYVSQSVHSQVPPDAITPVIRAIADNFISDGRANEVIAIGLNTVREICARQPLAMDPTLLQDLTQYKNFKDKGVMMAARSIMLLFRTVDPSLLKRKDRGRSAGGQSQIAAYGEQKVATGVEGLEFLDAGSSEEEEGEKEDDGDEDGEEEEGGEVEVGDDDEEEEEDDDDDDGEEEEDEDEEEEEGEEEEDDDDEGEEEEDDDESGEDNDDDEDEEEASDDQEEIENELKALKKKKQATKKKISSDGPVDTQRLLTQEDFERIATKRQQAKLAAEAGIKSKAKRKEAEQQRVMMEGEDGEGTGLPERVDPDSLQAYVKRPRQSKEERLECVIEGREGRQHWKDKHHREGVSTTNKAKLKKKAYGMIKKSAHVRLKMKEGLTAIRKKKKKLSKQFRGHMGGRNPRK